MGEQPWLSRVRIPTRSEKRTPDRPPPVTPFGNRRTGVRVRWRDRRRGSPPSCAVRAVGSGSRSYRWMGRRGPDPDRADLRIQSPCAHRSRRDPRPGSGRRENHRRKLAEHDRDRGLFVVLGTGRTDSHADAADPLIDAGRLAKGPKDLVELVGEGVGDIQKPERRLLRARSRSASDTDRRPDANRDPACPKRHVRSGMVRYASSLEWLGRASRLSEPARFNILY
jgi:hypothetical protein